MLAVCEAVRESGYRGEGKPMKDNLRRKTDAELEARRQRVLKVLDGEPPEPARMEQMLRRIEDEQARRGHPIRARDDMEIRQSQPSL